MATWRHTPRAASASTGTTAPLRPQPSRRSSTAPLHQVGLGGLHAPAALSAHVAVVPCLYWACRIRVYQQCAEHKLLHRCTDSILASNCQQQNLHCTPPLVLQRKWTRSPGRGASVLPAGWALAWVHPFWVSTLASMRSAGPSPQQRCFAYQPACTLRWCMPAVRPLCIRCGAPQAILICSTTALFLPRLTRKAPAPCFAAALVGFGCWKTRGCRPAYARTLACWRGMHSKLSHARSGPAGSRRASRDSISGREQEEKKKKSKVRRTRSASQRGWHLAGIHAASKQIEAR